MWMRLRTPEAAIAAFGSLWGLYWIPVRHLEARGVDAVWTTLGLFVGALALLVPFVVRTSQVRALCTPRILLTGLLTGGSFVLYSISIALTEVVSAILLFYLSPVWATLLGRVLLGERLTATRVAALALGFGGLWAVLGAETGVPLPRNPGDWCALTAGVTWAFGTLRVHQDTAIPSGVHTAALFIGGTAVIAVISLLPHVAGPMPAITVRAGSIIAILAVASVASAWGILWGARLVSPGRAGLLLMMEVITGLVSAALLAGEPFGIGRIVGSVLIVSAALVEVVPSAVRRRR